MVVLEAMAAGTPVLAVRAPGSAATELLEDGKGFLCGLEELEDSILRLLQDGALRKDLADRGYRYSMGFDWGAIAQKVLATYADHRAGGI